MTVQTSSVVYVVDDDPEVLRALVRCLEQSGHTVIAFRSAHDFLDQHRNDHASCCLLLDLCLAGTNGHEVQERLIRRGRSIPIIFMSGHAGIEDATQSLRRGAVDFLEKPLSIDLLRKRVADALEESRRRNDKQRRLDEIRQLLDGLTDREREVMELVVDGMATKVIASKLDISPKTVEVHRSRITRRMGVDSVAQLVGLMTEYRLAGKP